MTDSPTLTIGRVRKLLNDEFPDVTTSKIRFLETNGLVHPARSPSGYRHFRQSDVDRLRFILRQQRDHFLPLKVIKSQLTRLERGELPGGGVEPEEPLPVPEIADETFSLNELARRSDLTRAQVRQLLDHGLLAPLNAEGPHQFTTGDVAVARQCGVLLAEGLEPPAHPSGSPGRLPPGRTARQAHPRHAPEPEPGQPAPGRQDVEPGGRGDPAALPVLPPGGRKGAPRQGLTSTCEDSGQVRCSQQPAWRSCS